MNGKQINLQQGDPLRLNSYYTGMRNIINAVVKLNPEMLSLPSNQNIIIIIWKGPRSTTYFVGSKTKIYANFDYLKGKGIEVAALVFDGMMVYKNNVSDIAGIVKGCSSSVNQVLEGCGIEFTCKKWTKLMRSPAQPGQQPAGGYQFSITKGRLSI